MQINPSCQPYYEDITTTTNGQGLAVLRSILPFDKIIAVHAIDPKRVVAEMEKHNDDDTGYCLYVHEYMNYTSAYANTSCTFRVWKMP